VSSEHPICLIVDDEPDTCWALKHVLEKQGVRSRIALRAEQALEEVRRFPYALALLDAKLPDLDGLELARRIRALRPGIPIIVVSGYFYSDDPAIQEALVSGLIQGFVSKPFLHRDIVRSVDRLLAGRTDSRNQGTAATE
jgi:DNA-binding response OmpR family regulator